ncbi:WD repeat-containing protein 82-like [Teleopsis dalmanni]|uniref:WD repeat-containing protein 82-like n=1 Tax=Teleopsis dalmanni TaxID=139649 RepID=UPI0018CDCFF4|nr:WD repeat-containing protein 82-like [Teleopsis dalmanni]
MENSFSEFTHKTPEFNLELTESHIQGDIINSIDFSREGSMVVAACGDMISTHNIIINGNPSVINCQEKGASHVNFTHDKNKVLHVTCNGQQVVRMLDIEAKQYVCDYYSNTENTDALCLSPVPFHFVTSTDRNKIKIWDLRIPESHTTFETNARGAVACHIDGLWIAGCNEYGVHIYDMRLSHLGAIMSYARRCVFNTYSCIKFAPDGRKMVVASNDFVELINAHTIGPIRTYTGFSTDSRVVIETSFNHNSNLLFTGSSSSDAFLFDVNSSNCVHKLKQKENSCPVHCVKQNPCYMCVCTSNGKKLDFWTLNEDYFKDLTAPKRKAGKIYHIYYDQKTTDTKAASARTKTVIIAPKVVPTKLALTPVKVTPAQTVLPTRTTVLEPFSLTTDEPTEPTELTGLTTPSATESATHLSSTASLYTPAYASDTPTDPLTLESSSTTTSFAI